MIHQLRTYEIFEHNKAAFQQRFDQHAWRMMKRHGFEVLAFWEAVDNGGPVFVYLLQWPDEATTDDAWRSFLADEEWSSIKAATSAKHGQLVDLDAA
ncbi:MAG: NIPSNAP family protein [Acidimicrobiia bacterium]|nr:NIPSNAP family protein [Acidimicrobiia bacterium]